MSIILGLLTRLTRKCNARVFESKRIEDKLIDMFFTPTIIRKINNAKFRSYVHDKLKKELNIADAHHAEDILDSFDFKRQEKLQETIAERVKLNSRNIAGTGTIMNF